MNDYSIFKVLIIMNFMTLPSFAGTPTEGLYKGITKTSYEVWVKDCYLLVSRAKVLTPASQGYAHGGIAAGSEERTDDLDKVNFVAHIVYKDKDTWNSDAGAQYVLETQTRPGDTDTNSTGYRAHKVSRHNELNIIIDGRLIHGFLRVHNDPTGLGRSSEICIIPNQTPTALKEVSSEIRKRLEIEL